MQEKRTARTENERETNETADLANLLKIVPFIGSIILFIAAPVVANFRVESVQPNGLAQIIYPFELLSYALYSVAFALLLFAITLNLMLLKRDHKLRISIVSSSFLSSGVTLTSFFSFVFWSLETDYEGRCISPCEPFALQYSELAFGLSAVIALGVLFIGIAVWLLTNRAHIVKKDHY